MDGLSVPQLDLPGAGLPAIELLIARRVVAGKYRKLSRNEIAADFERERNLISTLAVGVAPERGARPVLMRRQRYNPGGLSFGGTSSADITDGILDLNFPDSPWYNDDAPEGDKILVLFSWDGDSEGALFGVQQELNTLIQENSRYTFRVSVGNIQSGNTSSGGYLNLDNFPGYRVQVLADGSVIYDDLNELTPETK